MPFDQLRSERGEQSIVQTASPTADDLNNSILFDLRHFKKDSPRVDFLYAQILSGLTDVPNNRVMRINLRCLIYNLVRLQEKRPGGVLVCPKQDAYWSGLGRAINPFRITKKVADLAERLEELGYVQFKTGSFFEDGSAYSRLWVTNKLSALILDSGIGEAPIVFTHGDDFVFFRLKVAGVDGNARSRRGGVKLPKEPATGRVAKRMSSVLIKYNNLLQQSDIRIPAVKNNGKENAHDYMVYRVFNNRELTLGGRFYGGFWEVIDKSLRKEILINGNSTSELDYKAQHPYLAYGCYAGTHYDDVHRDRDPYLLYAADGTPYDRDSCKSLLLTALNAKGDMQTWRAIKFSLRGDKGAARRIKNWSEVARIRKQETFFKTFEGNTKELLEATYKKHDKIRSYLCTGRATELQYRDSQIAEYVIKTLTEAGIVVLSVHDSFIVESQHVTKLEEAMKEGYKANELDKSLPPIVQR